MKCINKSERTLCILFVSFVLAANLTGCGAKEYMFAYDRDRNNTSFSVASHTKGKTMETFAASLCVTATDVSAGTDVDMSQATAAGLFDLSSQKVIYAKNVHDKLNPASLTKILTALCALKYANPDDRLTATENVHISESGAVKLGLAVGDTMTMDQALHALLLKSSNDVAVMIAEHVSGSVEEFAKLMNETANSLGATNSNFVNPHGLTDPNHYTTVYDLYLICNEAVNNAKIMEILQKPSYTAVYHDANGGDKFIDIANSNAYIKGEIPAPSGVTVLGGKTGTTSAAGNCLILFANDSSNKPYVAIILQSNDRTTMYTEMTDLLTEISS